MTPLDEEVLVMTNSTTPTETVDIIVDKLFHAGYVMHKASLDPRNSNGLRAIEDNSKDEAKSALRKAFESAVEAVIGVYVEHADYCCLKRSYFNMEDVACDCDARPINEEKKVHRQRAKEQIKLMFGE